MFYIIRQVLKHKFRHATHNVGMGTCGMFDWSLFDNSNQTSFVLRPSKVGMFDSDYVQRGAAIVEQNINRT
jgi:hypothetical protein